MGPQSRDTPDHCTRTDYNDSRTGRQGWSGPFRGGTSRSFTVRTMRTRTRRIFAWGLAVAGLIQFGPSRAADDQSLPETSDRNQKIKELMEASVKWYEVLPSAEASTPLTPQVAMRWINASRGRDAQDFLLLWVHDGRPVAAASVFPFGRDLCHELCSLSRNAELVARDRSGTVWAPESAGVKFHDVPDGPAPAGTPEL